MFFLKKILKLNKRSENILFNKKMNKKGFTLIELLIVVAVIGILASVILVGIGPVQKQGRDARRISDLRQVQNGLELYYNRNGAYPTGTSWDQLSATLINAGIGISNVPSDPTNNTTYYYRYGSDGASYVLGAQLEDTNNPRLNDDVDGIILGVDCNDPVYCIRL